MYHGELEKHGMGAYAGMFEALTSADQQEFRNARAAIIACGTAAVPGLTRAAQQSQSDRELWRILVTLGEIGDREAVPTMVAFLRSSNNAIAAVAAQFLARVKDARAVQPMLDLLNDTTPMTPIWIIDSLGKLGDPRAIDPLIALLNATESALHRYTAIEALGRLGDPRALVAIRPHIDDPDHHVRDRVRTAVEALTSRSALAGT